MESAWRPNVVEANKYLLDPTTPAVVLFSIVMAVIPDDTFEGADEDVLDPTILWDALRSELNIDLPPENETKISAMLMALSSDAHMKDPGAFRSIVIGLTRGDVDNLVDTEDDDVTAAEIAEALATIRTFDSDELTWSPSVSRFVLEEVIQEAAEDPTAEKGEDTLIEIASIFSDLGMPEDMLKMFVDTWCNAERL